VAFCAGITTLDALGACWDVNGIGFSDGDPDAVSYPVAGTLVPVPWAQQATAQVLVQPQHPTEPDGGWFDPRAILGRVLARFATLGLRPVVACELEFYFVEAKRADNGMVRPAASRVTGRANDSPRVLGLAKLDEWASLLAEVDAACIAQGVPAGAATAEYGGAQFEVNLQHTDDVVRAADHALMLRRIVKGVAARHGLDATFMSKPFSDQSGSGLHIHSSLWDRKTKKDLFWNVKKEHHMSDTMRHYLGGHMQLARDLQVFYAPYINSYKRCEYQSFAP
jgi:glutamine synthetase